MTGNYSISAYSQRGAINTSFFLNVQYGPDRVMAPDKVMVDEGDAVDISCSASGNPLPALNWMAGNQSIGSGVGVARLVLDSAQREDTGLYVCEASGSVLSPSQPVPTKLIVTQPVTIAEQDEEVKNSWASLGGRGQLVCQVRAAPSPTFLWTTNEGGKIYNTNKYLIHKPVEVDGLVTWSSVLEVFNVSLQDYQPYHCSATNPLGSGSTTLTLRPPSRPLPPTNLTVISVSNVSVVLGWTPNLAGSRPISYTVRYRPTGTRYFQYEEVPDGSSTGIELAGLTPDVEYSLTTQAKNNQGHSDYVTPPVIVTTLGDGGDSEGSEDGYQVTSFLLMVIIMSVFVLLVLNAAAIVCFLHYRKKKRTALRGVHPSNATLANTRSNITASSDHLQHHHSHNHVLLALDSLSCKRNKKSKGHLRQGRNKLANVIPLPSPSSHRNKVVHAGRLSKHTKDLEKRSSPFIRNGRIPRPLPFPQHNNKSSSYPLQVLAPDNSKTSKQRKQTISSSIPEACSLLGAHSQDKIIVSKPRHTLKDQDQLSESSHESTQTAIFCEDNFLVSPPSTTQEKPLHILENQRTQVSLHQLNNEVKQYFENKAAQAVQIEEGLSKSLEYINLENCTGDMIEAGDMSVQTQDHNCPQTHLAHKKKELIVLDDTTISSEYQGNMTTGPMAQMSLLHKQEGYWASTNKMQEPAIPHQQQDVQLASAHPTKNTNTLHSPAVPLDNWPPATSPSHMQQHRMLSTPPTRVRIGHQSLEPKTKTKQQRAVSCSPSIVQQGDEALESPPIVRHHRIPSESLVRVTHHMGQESPVRGNEHKNPPESPVTAIHHKNRVSPVKVIHQISPESPEIKRRQYRSPSESPIRSVHHISTESPTTAKNLMRKNSESPHRVAEHEGILKSPNRERSNFAPSHLVSRSSQQQGESSTNNMHHQRNSESPVRYREYHKTQSESSVGSQKCLLPPTPIRPHHHTQITSTPEKNYAAHPSPESPAGDQSNYSHQGLPNILKKQRQYPSSSQIVISRRSQTPSPTLHNPLSHKNPKSTSLSSKSSVPDITSPELHTNTHQTEFSSGKLNSSLPNPHPLSDSVRHNLPPTPPRPKKPRQLPSFPPSHPTLMQPLPQPLTNVAVCHLSPEETSTSFVLPETSQKEEKERALPHLPPLVAAAPMRSVGEVRGHESRKRFREIVKASGSPSTVRRQVAIQTDNYQAEQSTQSVSSMARHFASVYSPIATSSPLTHRRRARFPDDFLWQGNSGKM